MKPTTRASIARIEVMQGGESLSRGTGTLISESLVLTAFHVVADRQQEGCVPYPGTIHLKFPDFETEAEIHGSFHDRQRDWILMKCRTAPPAELLPVGLGELKAAQGQWEAFGFPDANPEYGMVVAGTVRSIDSDLFETRAFQLFSEEAAAGTGAPVKGLSGSPVLVDGRVVGVLRFALMQENRTVAGTVYACPAEDVAAAADLPIEVVKGGAPSLVTSKRNIGAALVIAAAMVVVGLWPQISSMLYNIFGDVPEHSVVVFDLADPTLSEQDRQRMDGFRLDLIDDLRTVKIETPDAERVTRLDDRTDLRSVRRNLQVANQLTGTASMDGGMYSLRVSMRSLPGNAEQWSQEFRAPTIDSILRLDDEIVFQMATALGIEISDSTRHRVRESGTQSVEAQDAYRAGLEFLDQNGGEALDSALLYFHRAISFDSTYVEAWAQLSETHGRKVFGLWGPSQERKDSALWAAERARDINPQLAAGHIALGGFYYSNFQYAGALAQFDTANAIRPGDLSLLRRMAAAYRRLGQWDLAADTFAFVSDKDPLNSGLAYSAGQTLTLIRHYDRAERYARRAVQNDRGDVVSFLGQAAFLLASGERPEVVQRSLVPWINADDQERTAQMFRGLILDEFRQILRVLTPEQRSVLGTATQSWAPGDTVYYHLAMVELLRDQDPDAVRSHADAAREITETRLATSDESEYYLDKAQALLALGEIDDAVEAAETAVSMSIDPYREMLNLWYLTSIYVTAGRPNSALEAARRALGQPGYLSLAWIQADPLFEGLRSDPEWAALTQQVYGEGGE